MIEETVRGSQKLNTSNSLVNALTFAIEQGVNRLVNTSELMVINQADQNSTGGPGGYASATPLVTQTDGFNNSIPVTTLPKLAYYRPQAGKAAIIMDPQPGDKALAVSMKRDTSGVGVGTTEAVPPASFRRFDQADSILFSGVLGPEPEIWLELNPVTGNIALSTKSAAINIECRESGPINITTKSGDIGIKTESGNVKVEATVQVTVTAPDTVINGNMRVTGGLVVEGETTGRNGGPSIFSQGLINRTGDIVNESGSITNTGGTVSSNSITLDTHTHAGVQSGLDDTGSPNSGT